jgi:hypothetical protein
MYLLRLCDLLGKIKERLARIVNEAEKAELILIAQN